jgi:hypothetical protein
MKKQFKSFTSARKYVRSLELKTQKNYSEYSVQGKLPEDIPSNPAKYYKFLGWTTFPDFLGTNNVATNLKSFWPFKKARKFVRELKLKNTSAWNDYCKSDNKPDNMPSSPERYYINEWISWPDFLGNGNIAFGKIKKLNYSKAQPIVQQLKIKSSIDWKKFVKENRIPNNIPKDPQGYYKNKGWKSWPDWLGTPLKKSYTRKLQIIWDFKKSRKFVHKLKLKSQKQWRNYYQSGNKPSEIPTDPSRRYKNKGWKSWPDWLGTDTIANRNRTFWDFDKSKKYLKKLGLKSRTEFYEKSKSGNISKHIPIEPRKKYTTQWKGWGDFLDTGNINSTKRSESFLSAKEAKPILKKLFKENNIENLSDWIKFASKNNKLLQDLHLPSNLLNTYSLGEAEKRKKQK